MTEVTTFATEVTKSVIFVTTLMIEVTTLVVKVTTLVVAPRPFVCATIQTQDTNCPELAKIWTVRLHAIPCPLLVKRIKKGVGVGNDFCYHRIAKQSCHILFRWRGHRYGDAQWQDKTRIGASSL
jgi:hypothetical protein